MIIGIGSDLVDIRRIEKSIDRFGEKFTARCFTDEEQARSNGRKDCAASYAKRFAAKEAIGKALGVGLHHPMSLHSVEILNDPRGAPVAVARKALAAYLAERQYHIHVSISDEIGHAQALAIVQTASS